jgi:hypothetical protein
MSVEKTIKVLEFLHARLVNVYGENPNYDYMLNLQEIIDGQHRVLRMQRAYHDSIDQAQMEQDRRSNT